MVEISDLGSQRGLCRAAKARDPESNLVYTLPNYNTSIIIDGMLIKVSICGNRETSTKEKTNIFYIRTRSV